MSSKRLYIVSAVCLVVGTVIYMACRSNILFLDWIGVKGHVVLTQRQPLRYWAVYCLPDGLWYMSLLCLEKALTQTSSRWSKIFWYVTIALPFVLELSQLPGWMVGTFDIFDLLTYLFTLIIFLVLCRKKLLF